MSAPRRRRGDEEDLSEGEEHGEEVTVSDEEGEDAKAGGIVSSESESDGEESDQSEAKEETEEIEKKLESVKLEKSDNEAKDENEEINEPEIASIPSEERDEDVEEDLQASQDGEEEEGDDAEDAENANEDEDERHPAYIPRKGLFFLHDDRIDNDYPEGVTGPKMDLEVEQEEKEEDEEPVEKESEPEEPVQPVEEEEMDPEEERAMRAARKAERMIEKWSHDKYDDDLQLPRTQQELVDRYGFDIRALNPEEIDFTRPLGQQSDSPNESGSRDIVTSRRGGATSNASRRSGNNRPIKNNRRVQNGNDGMSERGSIKASKGSKKRNEDFPELIITKRNDKNPKSEKTNQSKGPNPRSTRSNDKNDPKLNKKGRDDRLIEDREVRQGGKGRKGETQRAGESKNRKDQRDNFKKGGIHEDQKIQNSGRGGPRNQRGLRRESERNDYNEKSQPDTRVRRKQEQRRRVEAEREHRDLQLNDGRGGQGRVSGRNPAQSNGRSQDMDYIRNNRGGQRSPPRQRIEDPAPPIRSRRYSSDLSDEDINERRHARPPPPRRKKSNSSGKPKLHVEVANVADILAKHENQARKAKHDYERIRESPIKGGRRERKDDRRRESDTRVKAGRPDEKVNKRYSARARPDHWNNRQSPSPQPMQNDQNFNDRSQIQEDPLQDALEKHFNVSAAQAKKFMNQIKNQLHVNPPGESGDINSRFGQHGVSTASAGNDSISHLVDSKSNRNNIGIRDRTNEQSLAFQAYQQQQLQAQFLQSQAAAPNNHPFGSDATAMDLVTRMTQQDPTFFNQTRQQPVVPPMYAQQQVQKSIYDVSSPSAYVNPSSISQQQQLANHSLIQNGTTYFQMEQHNRNKY